MMKNDIQFAKVFMKREEGAQLVFDTNDDQVILKDPDNLFFTDEGLVINEFPKMRLKYGNINNIFLSYESDFFIEYMRLIKIAVGAWNLNYDAKIYILYDDMYYYINKEDLLEMDNINMSCKLDGKDSIVEYKDIKELRVNITFLEV